MKEIKKTITREEITGYEAFDGYYFKNAEECRAYESSAVGAAKAAAWHYVVDVRSSFDLFNDDWTEMTIFDIPDVNAYEILLHWMRLENTWERDKLTPDYIGKRVALMGRNDEDDHWFSKNLATKEAAIAYYTAEIEAMFADKETKAE